MFYLMLCVSLVNETSSLPYLDVLSLAVSQTSPFFWYFYSALPRALLFVALLVPVSCLTSVSSLIMAGPAAYFTLLLSLLPHKELRFIIYTIPCFNTAAACGAASMSVVCACLWTCLVCWLSASFLSPMLRFIGS